MSAEDVYDIYDDAGFDADGLEDVADIYDDIDLTPPKPAPAPRAPKVAPEPPSKPKEPEIKKEAKPLPTKTEQVSSPNSSLMGNNNIGSPTRPQQSLSRGPTSAAIHISNLHWWTSEDDLRLKIGEITSPSNIIQVVFQEYKVNGKSRGLAYVEFRDASISTKVKDDLDKQPILDRPCTTNYTAVTATPFRGAYNGNPRNGQNGQDSGMSGFVGNPVANMSRPRGRMPNQRPGAFQGQSFPQGNIANFPMAGSGFPGGVPPFLPSYPGIWGQQGAVPMQISGMPQTQNFNAYTNNRNFNNNNNSNSSNHNTGNNKRMVGNDNTSRPNNRRRYD